MNASATPALLDLAPRESLLLADARGTTLRVTRGTLWVTQQDDTRDAVLRPGDAWTVELDGDTIVEAQTAATVALSGRAAHGALQGPRLVPARRPGRLAQVVRERFAAWWSLTPRRHIPYV